MNPREQDRQNALVEIVHIAIRISKLEAYQSDTLYYILPEELMDELRSALYDAAELAAKIIGEKNERNQRKDMECPD